MKRSRSIRLVLIGGLSAGVATGCGRAGGPASRLSGENVYTNNFHVPGAGYYHAPYRAWFALPYNHFDPQSGRYFHGGLWSAQPHASITNLSAPTPESVRLAQALRHDVPRGGFGGTSRHHSFLG